MRKLVTMAGAVAALSATTALSPTASAETVFTFSNWIPWTHKLSTRL